MCVRVLRQLLMALRCSGMSWYKRLSVSLDQTCEPAVESGDSEHLKRQNPPSESAAPSPSEAPLKLAAPARPPARHPACRRGGLVLRRSTPHTFVTLLAHPVKNPFFKTSLHLEFIAF